MKTTYSNLNFFEIICVKILDSTVTNEMYQRTEGWTKGSLEQRTAMQLFLYVYFKLWTSSIPISRKKNTGYVVKKHQELLARLGFVFYPCVLHFSFFKCFCHCKFVHFPKAGRGKTDRWIRIQEVWCMRTSLLEHSSVHMPSEVKLAHRSFEMTLLRTGSSMLRWGKWLW